MGVRRLCIGRYHDEAQKNFVYLVRPCNIFYATGLLYQEFVYQWGRFLSYWTQKIGFSINIFIGKPVMTDVLHTSGQFFLRYQPFNNEIDGMLQMQGDNNRDFMTIATDGGFIHAPVWWVESKVVMCSSETLIGSCCKWTLMNCMSLWFGQSFNLDVIDAIY